MENTVYQSVAHFIGWLSGAAMLAHALSIRGNSGATPLGSQTKHEAQASVYQKTYTLACASGLYCLYVVALAEPIQMTRQLQNTGRASGTRNQFALAESIQMTRKLQNTGRASGRRNQLALAIPMTHSPSIYHRQNSRRFDSTDRISHLHLRQQRGFLSQKLGPPGRQRKRCKKRNALL